MQDKRLARLKKRAKKYNLTIRAEKGAYKFFDPNGDVALDSKISTLDDVEWYLDYLDEYPPIGKPEFFTGRVREFEFSVAPLSVPIDGVTKKQFVVVPFDTVQGEIVSDDERRIGEDGESYIKLMYFDDRAQAERAVHLCELVVARAIQNYQAAEQAHTPAQA